MTAGQTADIRCATVSYLVPHLVPVLAQAFCE